jgi:outer membrane protein TolC
VSAVFAGQVDEFTARSLETARRQLADHEARLEAGVGSDLDVASAAARVAELEARQVEVQMQRSAALDTLRLLLGLPESEPLELVDDFDAIDAALASPPALEHPALESLAAQSEALEHHAEAVGRTFWPHLDVFASVAYQFPRTFVETDQAGIVYAAGAALTWDLFDGSQRESQEAQLRSQSSATRQAREAGREELLRARLDAQSRMESADARLEAAGRQLASARTYLEVAQTAHRAGAGTALDVLTAEGAVDRARLAAAGARLERALARADLLRAMGVAATDGESGTPSAGQ